MKKLNAIDKQNLDGAYGATAVALDWPEGLSEKGKLWTTWMIPLTFSITLESTSSPTKASGLRNMEAASGTTPGDLPGPNSKALKKLSHGSKA